MSALFTGQDSSNLSNVYIAIPQLDTYLFGLIPLLRSLTPRHLANVNIEVPQPIWNFLTNLTVHPLFSVSQEDSTPVISDYILEMMKSFADVGLGSHDDNEFDISLSIVHLRRSFMEQLSTLELSQQEWFELLMNLSDNMNHEYANDKAAILLAITLCSAAILKTQQTPLPLRVSEDRIDSYQCILWEAHNHLTNYTDALYQQQVVAARHLRKLLEYTGIHFCLNYLFVLRVLNRFLTAPQALNFNEPSQLHYSTFSQAYQHDLHFYESFTTMELIPHTITIPFNFPGKLWTSITFVPLMSKSFNKYLLIKLHMRDVVTRVIYSLTTARFVASNVLVYTIPHGGIPVNQLHHDAFMTYILEVYQELVSTHSRR